MFAWIKDWLIWLDGQITKNRPRRRSPQPPPDTVFEGIMPDELRHLCQAIGDSKYAETLIRNHELAATGFELNGKWYIIVHSHFNDKKRH